MNQPNNRRRDPAGMSGQSLAVLVIAGGAAVLGVGAWTSVTLAHQWAGTADTLPSDPFKVVIDLFRGRIEWWRFLERCRALDPSMTPCGVRPPSQGPVPASPRCCGDG